MVRTQNLRPNLIIRDGNLILASYNEANTSAVSLEAPVTVIPEMNPDGTPVPPVASINIKVDDWLRALSTAGDTVDISIDDKVTIVSGGYRNILSVYPPAEGSVKLPNVPYSVTVLFDPTPIKRLIASAPKDNDIITLSAITAGQLAVSSHDDNGNGIDATLEEEAMDVQSPAQATYMMAEWSDFIGSMPKGTVEMRFGQDMPVMFVFSADGINGIWLTAPRVSEE